MKEKLTKKKATEWLSAFALRETFSESIFEKTFAQQKNPDENRSFCQGDIIWRTA